MNLYAKLSELKHIHLDDILEITYHLEKDEKLKEEFYQLMFDEDYKISYRALWVATHFSLGATKWFCSKQDELIDELLVCPQSGKRRMILSLLYRLTINNPPRVDFLDFCLERMASPQEPPAVQSLCIKLANVLTRSIPELQQELRIMLEMMETELLSPAQRSARKNVLQEIKSRNK